MPSSGSEQTALKDKTTQYHSTPECLPVWYEARTQLAVFMRLTVLILYIFNQHCYNW